MTVLTQLGKDLYPDCDCGSAVIPTKVGKTWECARCKLPIAEKDIPEFFKDKS